jgi:TMEM175 potassium channel family protein
MIRKENNSSDNFQVHEWRKRLRFLADIIFATAMTIMILNIEIPEFGHITDTKELAVFLIKQLNSMWVFFIAFVVIAVYWMKHLEHFSVILIVNQTFIWFQLLFLAFIMLIPFWNTYIEQFPENVAIRVFLSINMVLVGGFSFLSLNYAASSKHRLLHDGVSDRTINEAKRQTLTEPLIAILAAGLAFISPVLWDLAFILVPLAFMARKKLVTVKYFRLKKPN